MSVELQAYTSAGLLRASLPTDERLADLIGTLDSLHAESGVLMPLDGSPPARHGALDFDADDLIVVVAPEDISAPVHAAWNPVVLTASPYIIEAELPMMPGFDPGRALARPSGPFVLVGRVKVGLSDDPSGGRQEHDFCWVNRYAVERVAAQIELVFFFPGAQEDIDRRQEAAG
jgi:hypothetical protein